MCSAEKKKLADSSSKHIVLFMHYMMEKQCGETADPSPQNSN